MSSKTIWNTLIVSSFVSAAVAGGNPTLILDDFDNEPNDDAGGPRELFTTVLDDGDFGGLQRFDVVTDSMFDGDEGSLVFETGTGVEMQSTIRWDNADAGLGLDAAALGLLGFELDFAVIDQDFDLELTLEDGNGLTTSIIRTVLAHNSSDPIRIESFGIGEFDLTGFDATNVASVEFTFNRRSGVVDGLDFAALEFRAVVPTPGSIALLGLGGLLAARRRR